MKKIAIIMLALLPALTGWSQDTVSNPYSRGYCTNNIPDTNEAYSIGGVPTLGASCGIVAKEMSTSQTLKIWHCSLFDDRTGCTLYSGNSQ